MAEGSNAALGLLASIDVTLKAILKALSTNAPKAIAEPRDLDGQYGNPEVRFLPRDWTGPSFKGQRYSECPPEFLDMLASSLDYFAGKDEAEGATTAKGKPSAPFRRADAARARGWAQRIRGGWKQSAGAANGATHAWAAGAEDGDF